MNCLRICPHFFFLWRSWCFFDAFFGGFVDFLFDNEKQSENDGGGVFGWVSFAKDIPLQGRQNESDGGGVFRWVSFTKDIHPSWREGKMRRKARFAVDSNKVHKPFDFICFKPKFF